MAATARLSFAADQCCMRAAGAIPWGAIAAWEVGVGVVLGKKRLQSDCKAIDPVSVPFGFRQKSDHLLFNLPAIVEKWSGSVGRT